MGSFARSSGSALIDFEALLISLPGGHRAGFARDFFAAVCMTLWSFSFDSSLLTVSGVPS